MAKENEFTYVSVQDCSSVTDYLNEICKGINKGELYIKNGNREINVFPQGMLDFEIKLKSKDGRSKLQVKLSWNEKEIKRSRTKNLKISSPQTEA